MTMTINGGKDSAGDGNDDGDGDDKDANDKDDNDNATNEDDYTSIDMRNKHENDCNSNVNDNKTYNEYNNCCKTK